MTNCEERGNVRQSVKKKSAKQHRARLRKQGRLAAKHMRVQRSQQLSLLNDKVPRLFGGSLLKGHAKCARPLSTKEPIHLVLKSRQAVGPNSMLRPHNAKRIETIIRKQAKSSGITIYQLVNVGNHLHIVMRITNLFLYDRFIRAIAGLIARHVTQRERGDGRKVLSRADVWKADVIQTEAIQKKQGSSSTFKLKPDDRTKHPHTRTQCFWQARPFTRLIAWGQDYRHIRNYMNKNRHQANPKRYFVAWGFEITNERDIQFLNTG